MNKLIKVVLSVAALFSVATAQAFTVVEQQYSWSGTCTDCLGAPNQASAVLTLAGYAPGVGLEPINFRSFSYLSSNYPSGILVEPDGLTRLSGILPATPGPASIDITWLQAGIAGHFSTSDLGNSPWSLELTVPVDQGTGGIWMPGVIPEPETYAMMLAGLGLLGLMARRRKLQQAA